MDDTISRQAAIDALNDYLIGKRCFDNGTMMAQFIERNVLRKLPPAQPEPFGTIKHAGSEHPLSDSEIIPRLREIRDQVGGSYAIDRAIELLTAQPEPCEDAVSRKNCLQALSHLMDVDGFRSGWAVSRANVECMLKAMPSVMPKQRTGYWIPVGVAEVVGGESAMWGSAIAYHKCSECDEQALKDDFEQEVLSKWCPHCGAKMEGVSE